MLLTPDIASPDERHRRGRRWPGAVLVAAVVGIGIYERSGVAALVLLFVVVVPFEKLFPRHRQRLRRPGLGTDLAYGAAQPVFRLASLAVGGFVAAVSLAWLPGLLLRPAVALLPFPAKAVLGVVLFDLASYWGHRFSHEVPFLWRFHVIHHSSPRLDWVSGIRVHPLDGLVIGPAVAFLFAAGFSAKVTGVVLIAQLIVGVFLHANVRWRVRPLQRLVATPEFHHWHHANEPDALNKNYSALLPVWDSLFGTYFMPHGRRPQVYGTDEPVPTSLMSQIRFPLTCDRSVRQILSHPRVEGRLLRRNVRRGIAQMADSVRRGPMAGSGQMPRS
jgi:sterol desaturase/sphingolipid hydroxylase (fatty acid hydroxylase superfamily)